MVTKVPSPFEIPLDDWYHAKAILDTGKPTLNFQIPRVVLFDVSIFWPMYCWGNTFPKIKQKLKMQNNKLYLARENKLYTYLLPKDINICREAID